MSACRGTNSHLQRESIGVSPAAACTAAQQKAMQIMILPVAMAFCGGSLKYSKTTVCIIPAWLIEIIVLTVCMLSFCSLMQAILAQCKTTYSRRTAEIRRRVWMLSLDRADRPGCEAYQSPTALCNCCQPRRLHVTRKLWRPASMQLVSLQHLAVLQQYGAATAVYMTAHHAKHSSPLRCHDSQARQNVARFD